MRPITIPSLMALCLSACASETSMSSPTPAADGGLQPVTRDGGPAKRNPNPVRAVELVLTLENAPGPFAQVRGSAQYDVENEGECGRINPVAGIPERITSFESIPMTRVSDTEYRGTVYFDAMVDEDYYGRGVCRWKLSGVGAVMRATGADGETVFQPYITADEIEAGTSVDAYFWQGGYPRSSMPDYPDSGFPTPDRYKPDIRDQLFKITWIPQGARP